PKPKPEPKKQQPKVAGAAEGTVPNESVATIEPKVAELEAARPDQPAEINQAAETPASTASEDESTFSESEIADLQESAGENLNEEENR
ncbi:MAG: hypothetical protein ACK4UN_06545, partial [Limisphaerales bacterium]